MGEGVLALEAGPAGGRRRACIPVIVVSVRARAPAPAKRRGAHAAGGSVSRAPPPRCRARTPARGIANTSPVAPRPRHRRRALRCEEIARPRRIAGEYDYNYETTSRASAVARRAGPWPGGSATLAMSAMRVTILMKRRLRDAVRAGLAERTVQAAHEPPPVRRPSATASRASRRRGRSSDIFRIRDICYTRRMIAGDACTNLADSRYSGFR